MIDTEQQEGREGVTDFAKVVIKRKRLIVGIVVLSLVIGVLFCLFSKKVYMVDSIIEVGSYPGEKDASIAIENPAQLTEKIVSGSYDASIKRTLSFNDKRPLAIKAENPDSTNLVHVYVQSTRPTVDEQVLKEVDALIMAEHGKRIASRIPIPVGLVPTTVVKEPTIAAFPQNQQPFLTIILSLIVGFFAGLFVAFGKEWWDRSLKS